MRTFWRTLQASLVRSASTSAADEQFQIARGEHEILARFERPLDLAAHLNSPHEDLSEKNAIYAVLVTTAQERGPWADLATSLLWCGMWPALDRIYQNHLHNFQTEPEAVSAIAEAFTALIRRLDLSSVRRIAASLSMSTERDVVLERRRFFRSERFIDHNVTLDQILASPPGPTVSPSQLGIPPGLELGLQIAMLHKFATAIVGEDADIILYVLLFSEGQQDASEYFGVPYEAFRKRAQRARKKIRELESPSSHPWLCPFGSEWSAQPPNRPRRVSRARTRAAQRPMRRSARGAGRQWE